MDIKRVEAAQEYEDFVPTSMMVQEKDYDTLLFNLTGFKKEQVKVQLSKTGILNISGQRLVYKWQRFQKDIPVSENCDKSKISARFVNGNILCVKYPKLIISEEKKDKKLPASANEPHAQKENEEQATMQKGNAENVAAKEPILKEEPKNTNPKTSEQTEAISLPKSTSEDGKATISCSKPNNQSINDKELPAGDAQLPNNAANTPAKEPELKEEPKKTSPKTNEQTEAKSLPKSTSEDGKITSLFTKPDDQSINDKELPARDAPLPNNPASEPQQHQNTTSIDEPKINKSRTSEQTRVKPDNDNSNNNNNNNNTASVPNKLGSASDLFAKLKMRKEVISMTLVALLVLGVGRYVINVMKSPKKDKE
ncbi:PREDICTED: inactive protein RESTRICTED TEV MOVEMENT 2-like [Nicotiana attenuata]|uniref:SHSP domain-containing protein n=1 Tax=Nicotiana attenuata TaxID=49451 RepID=A0A1J6IQT0_NICAT|nr:PREDICTED: inactive protein RESTRICTED TEV MOVEMENT 2-like [Nicotiana attenuata]OIT07557.1 hypothetical protein A4A49_05588 [Nicotiana attenuata]